MKAKLIFFLIILFASCSFTLAQENLNHGLILRGQIYDGTRENYKDYVVWKAKLAMQFINQGTEPIILINPQGRFGKWQKKVSFILPVRGCSNNCENYLFTKNIQIDEDNSLEYKILTESLDTPQPAENLTLSIKPGESVSFDDKLEITQKFENGKYNQITWEGPKISDNSRDKFSTYPLICFPYLTVKYELSLIEYQKDANLLENLQSRWNKFGFFPVDLNGGFSITSESIRNNYGYKISNTD